MPPESGEVRPRLFDGAFQTGLGLILVAAAYYACARLGYTFAIPKGIVALWPPSGLMLGLLAVSDRRDWPAIVVGGLVGSLLSDFREGYSVLLAVSAALANGTETLVAAWVVRAQLRRPMTLASLRDVAVLVGGAAVASNAVTSLLGMLVLHFGFGVGALRAWFIWWVGDGLGMVIIAPTVVAGVRGAGRRRLDAKILVEALLVFIPLVIVSQITLGPVYSWSAGLGPFAVFPFLLWAGLRLGPAGAAGSALIVASVATWNAALGVGPFAGGSLSAISAAMQTYAYIAVAAACALIPAAVIRERSEAGRRQAKSESQYRSVVEAATDAVVTIDSASRIRFVNAAAEDIFGYAPEELIGHELTILMPESSRQRHRDGLARYLATNIPSISWRAIRLTGLHKNGSEVPIEISFGAREEDGARVFTGIIRDISEQESAARALRDAELRMAFALDASRVGTWEVDLQTDDMRCSAIFEALHGVAPGAFGRTMSEAFDRIHPDDRESVRDAVATATHDHADSNILYRVVWPDGGVHWINSIGHTFYDQTGRPIRAAGVALDVTEHHSLEERYRHSQKMQAIGQLAGGVAHDFNNLLTVIKSYGSMLAEQMAPGSQQSEDVAEVLSAADRATALTRQLLAFSRREVLAPRPVNVSDSLRGLEPMLRRLIGEHIEIVVRAPSDVGLVIADPAEIEQIILNLAVNARDAMPDGGRLTLETASVELDASYRHTHGAAMIGPHVMIAVSDSGVGMDAATASRVFEPFFTTKPAGKGTGLGLATVYGIVTRNHGDVAVYTEPGRGTTFRVYLPRAAVPAASDGTGGPAHSTAGFEQILLVEDDGAIRTAAARILQAAGYRVQSAGSGAEAFEAIDRNGSGVDLLLTDVVLPEMNGRQVAERMSARFPKMKVLYMSGYTDDIVVRLGVLERDVTFLQKPFSRSGLLSAVRTALDR